MNDDTLGRQKQEFDDQQQELAGTGHKVARFYNDDKSERARQKKADKRSLDRILDELAQRRLNPVYEAAFQAANDAIDRAQAALDTALEENAQHISDLEDGAARLPDGRAVFVRADGSGETADGEIIPAEVMDTLDIPDDATTIEDYDAARERRRALGGYGEDINKARRKANDPNNPADKPTLDDIARDMDDLTRKMEGVPDISDQFDRAAAQSVDERAASIPLPPLATGQ